HQVGRARDVVEVGGVAVDREAEHGDLDVLYGDVGNFVNATGGGDAHRVQRRPGVRVALLAHVVRVVVGQVHQVEATVAQPARGGGRQRQLEAARGVRGAFLGAGRVGQGLVEVGHDQVGRERVPHPVEEPGAPVGRHTEVDAAHDHVA